MFLPLPLPMYRNWCEVFQMCVSWLKTVYEDVLQANNLWKWNHFLAKLCNLTLELCHISPTMNKNWQQEFQMVVSWFKHLYRDML